MVSYLMLTDGAMAHRWNMRTFPVERGWTEASCATTVLLLADRINDTMGKKGYTRGKIASGKRAVRLDNIGYPEASMYLYCSEASMYIFTSHSPVDDDKFFSDLYNTMLNEFKKLREQ